VPLPKLTYPHLDLPDGPETIAFDAILKVFKNDPVLERLVRTLVIWDGSITDTSEPAVSMCPFLKVSPFPTESFWITEGQHFGPLMLRVQCAVVGTRAREILNFWNAVRTAILPVAGSTQNAVVVPALTAAGVTKPTVQMSAYGWVGTGEDGVNMLVADGTVKFGLYIPT
jgi:hypothetical protein